MNKKFFDLVKTKFNINFNEKQREAITHKDGPILVLASPGSGKTTVLNGRIAHLILNHNIDPKNILAITFSKAAASDMNERFYETYGSMIKGGVKFSTIHSFAYKIVREYYRKNNIKYDLIEGKSCVYDKKSIFKLVNKTINNSSLNDDKMEELSNVIGYIKNRMIQPEDFKDYGFQIRNLDKIYLAYESYKKNNEYGKVLLDFDDMLIEANKILESDKTLLKICQGLYKYILVDEGQDTSLIQNKIIEKIALPQNNIFMVCDDDQSIFGFRGADAKYLLDFQSRYPTAKLIFMEENYRSTRDIVDISNKLISNNKERYPKDMFTSNKPQKPIRVIKLDSQRKQIEYVIEALKKEKDTKDIAILYRNNISSIEIAQRLYEENISFYMKDYHKGFFNHWALYDILNFVRFSFDDTNISLLEAIYIKFDSYISKKELEYARNHIDGRSVFDILTDYPQIKDFKKKRLSRFKNDFRFLKTLKPERAIKFIMDDLNYEKRLQEYCEVIGSSFENIKIILEILLQLSKDTTTMQEYVDKLNNLKRVMHEARTNKNDNLLTLSTIHSSKGLEFKKVYMIDLIEGQIPANDSIKLSELGDQSGLEEERRLFYVGMTRAKQHLELITIENVNDSSVVQSRFINEVQGYMKKENISYLPYDINSIVRHKKFGLGLVKNMHDLMITIDFEERGVKDLAIEMCIKKNLLEVIKCG